MAAELMASKKTSPLTPEQRRARQEEWLQGAPFHHCLLRESGRELPGQAGELRTHEIAVHGIRLALPGLHCGLPLMRVVDRAEANVAGTVAEPLVCHLR